MVTGLFVAALTLSIAFTVLVLLVLIPQGKENKKLRQSLETVRRNHRATDISYLPEGRNEMYLLIGSVQTQSLNNQDLYAVKQTSTDQLFVIKYSSRPPDRFYRKGESLLSHNA